MVNLHATVFNTCKFDTPLQHLGLGLIPILNTVTPALPDILIFEEAIAAGVLHITEVDKAGHVPALKADNSGTAAVLILEGDQLIGDKQNRILNTTVLILPGTSFQSHSAKTRPGGRFSARIRA